MRIALIAPPFISVPPKRYGGTELFVAHLAEGIQAAGHDAVVYTVGDSAVNVERRWLFEKSEWPLPTADAVQLKDLAHTSWSVADAAAEADLIHVQSAPALSFSKVVSTPFVYTLHHPHEAPLSQFYSHFPEVEYAAISDFQRRQEKMPHITTIHHGVDMRQYTLKERKQDYLLFIGRIAPVKGTHIAIDVAKRSGMPLKIAGEIQPIYREYWETQVKPHVDGHFIEYVGEADLATKNELFGNARATVFPIQWNEPFGLVMIESMACGTPVLALPGGSVPEVVKDGVSGYMGKNAVELAYRAMTLDIDARMVRRYCERFFSVKVMVEKYLSLYERAARIREAELSVRDVSLNITTNGPELASAEETAA